MVKIKTYSFMLWYLKYLKEREMGMKGTGSITLRDEIYLNDAYKISDWLENEEITRFLSEGKDIGKEIRRTIMYTTCPVVTHLFCLNGNFYMIDLNDKSIGYLKLVPKGNGCEIVIVIGDSTMWNMGYGHKALKEALMEAFFKQRYESIVAKIMHGNNRSKRLFEKCGFEVSKITESLTNLELKISGFLKKVA